MLYGLEAAVVQTPKVPASAGTLQWDKLMLSGNFPHLARWYDFLCGLPELQDVAEQYGPKRRKTTPTASPAEAAKDASQKSGKAASKAAAVAPGGTTSCKVLVSEILPLGRCIILETSIVHG